MLGGPPKSWHRRPYRTSWPSSDADPREAALVVYFDTSALLKLVFVESGSDLAVELWDAADLRVSSQLVYPEARAVAAMAHRMERIDARALRSAVGTVDALYGELRVLGVDEELAQRAGELAERHGLRGYDAVHLASAISIRDDALVVATWDGDLADAVVACGHRVAPA